MKRRILLLLALAGITTLAFLGCGSQSANLKLEDGVLSWDADKSADHYEVELNDISVTCEEPQVNLSEVCEYKGSYTVTVSAVSDADKEKEIGSLDITAQEIEKPDIVVKQSKDGKTSFVWTAQENVSSYQYDMHDGYGLRPAETTSDMTCKVEFEGKKETLITVIARGNSDGNVLYMDNEATYHHDGTELFSMAQLAKYPYYITTDGQLLNELVVGTTLPKGSYDLDITFYLMDPNGRSLSGNGSWGRRVTHLSGNAWFCAEELDGWPGSGNTLPTAIESITYTCKQNVNKYGETTLSLYSWKANEMLVVADIKYNGKSVMTKALTPHPEEKQVVFDVSKLSDFLAVFRGTGRGWHEDFKEEFELTIPTNIADGVYKLEISYQVMNTDGTRLEGNGTGLRRIYDADMREVQWLCEYPVEGQTEGMDELPDPNQTLKVTFPAVVKNGSFKIMCLHFKDDELLAVSSVKKISGSSRHFDLSTLKKYNNVFVSGGPNGSFEKFRIDTTLCQRGQFEVEVSYYAMGSNGYMLDGNGTWGRRMMDEGSDEHWICLTAPSEEHQDAVNTVPEPDKAVTKTMKVTMNKKGRFFLDMHDFREGEIVVIKDVTYQGKSILVK